MIAIAMDVFTDVDIFKELVSATLRGVVVYILLDDSHMKSFMNMSHRVGINIRDLKSLRVRTVRGQQYRCRSGIKFHGGLKQKFILVDCQTVMYGTYSYTWSFEKINMSMVLVVTGQLVCSYDEEFRRLYALSTVPVIPLRGRPSVMLQSPSSSQLSLNQIHMRSRLIHGMRGAQDDRFSNAAMLTRVLSMQDKLHRSHSPDTGNLVRGHSYGGELQKINSMTRLRMGTKDLGIPFPPERNGFNTKGSDLPLTNRLSQQHLRHQTRYGADHNLIPFNSETSLHRWKMDTYFNESDMLTNASSEALTPMASPYSSHTGLNEHQTPLIHNKSKDIKTRMEEMRLKRFSLNDYANLRQCQESYRSMYATLERPKLMPHLRNPDIKPNIEELDMNIQDGCSLEDFELKKDGDKRDLNITDGRRPPSPFNIKAGSDRKAIHAYNWYDTLSRTISATELDSKQNDATLKLPHLQSGNVGMPHLRTMESLTELPEEKESSTSKVNSGDPVVKCGQKQSQVSNDNSGKTGLPTESQSEVQTKGSHSSLHKVGNKLSLDRINSTSSEVEAIPKIVDVTQGSPYVTESKGSQTENDEIQKQEASVHWKHSGKKKVHTKLSIDEKKASKKEEKPLQRKSSLKWSNSSGSKTDPSQTSAAAQTAKKGHSLNSPSGLSDTEKHKSPFARFSPQRLSKKKAATVVELDQGSSSTLDDEGATLYQAKREKAYSRYEYLLSTENIRLDKSVRTTSMYTSDKEKSASLNRQECGSPNGQSSTDNKLGRFMQRVGNIIKNK
ncbi:protein FAM83B-like isoform X2 [Gouania willdenowi]|nr:protein FAM83B-like isoform X2 [Gouania willdenowi]